jgi:MoxR-like ATPase
MGRIVDVHFPKLKQNLLREAMEVFFELREVPGMKKKPSTSELLDWIRLLVHEGISPDTLAKVEGSMPPLAGALLKSEQDTAHVRHAGVRRSRRA